MTKEEVQGLLLLVGLLAFSFGFKTGYLAGKRDLLLGLQSALRTLQPQEQ
jgi:hypothetical protein